MITTLIVLFCEVENDPVHVVCCDPEPKKRNKFQWHVDSEYDNLDEALEVIENAGLQYLTEDLIELSTKQIKTSTV